MVLPAQASLRRRVSARGRPLAPNPPPRSCYFSAVLWAWVSTTAGGAGSDRQSKPSDPQPSRKSEATPPDCVGRLGAAKESRALTSSVLRREGPCDCSWLFELLGFGTSASTIFDTPPPR